ncbi:unnamed protein product, partial [Vitis vinifera]
MNSPLIYTIMKMKTPENACLEERGSKFIKIWVLVTRRALKMDFSKLEILSCEMIQEFNLKQ